MCPNLGCSLAGGPPRRLHAPWHPHKHAACATIAAGGWLQALPCIRWRGDAGSGGVLVHAAPHLAASPLPPAVRWAVRRDKAANGASCNARTCSVARCTAPQSRATALGGRCCIAPCERCSSLRVLAGHGGAQHAQCCSIRRATTTRWPGAGDMRIMLGTASSAAYQRVSQSACTASQLVRSAAPPAPPARGQTSGCSLLSAARSVRYREYQPGRDTRASRHHHTGTPLVRACSEGHQQAADAAPYRQARYQPDTDSTGALRVHCGGSRRQLTRP
jgi:hypothetical protein